jgi:hypothetical protein
MPKPKPTDTDCPYAYDGSHNPATGYGWHTTFDPPFTDDCYDLNNKHQKTGYLLDPVPNNTSLATSATNPPSNITYTIIHNEGIANPKLENNFSIDIHWVDHSASVQSIEILRADLPEIKFIKQAPAPTTTKGWFFTDPTDDFLNPIVTKLNWGQNYVFLLRTSYQFVGASKIFSEWVNLSIFERNDAQRRKNDKCAIETLESMEVRLSQNFSEIPKSYRYSKIIKGGSRKVICKTWRPQGWKNGSFLKEDYPITMTIEEETAQNKEQNAGKALCGGEPCIPGDTGSELTKISPYTGGLIFGTAALNFKEGGNILPSLQIYPCGKSMRRTGGKLPIN